jgi:hypothetical protein
MRELTGTKRGNSGAANARTKERAALFQDLLTRFQVRYDRHTAAPKRVVKKTPRRAVNKASAARRPRRIVSAKAPASTGAAAGAPIGSAGFMSPRAKLTETRLRAHKSRGVSINAHTRAQGRRNQAKRDRR